MKANVLFGINDLRYTEAPMPTLKKGEVLVKVRAAGICGSDIARVFKTGTYHFPTIIGHEFSGEVCEVAEKVNSFWIGKKVTVFPLKPCFQCENCKEKQYELCSQYDYLGSRCDGGFAEYVAVPAWNLLELPDSISFEEAAMMEPTSVALHALKQSEFKEGDAIAVIGPGTIGMILCRVAILLGASKVILIGRNQTKLDFARRYGIENTCNSIQSDVFAWIDAKMKGKGVDIAFEGTGASTSLNTCLKIVKPSGKIVTYGNPIDDIALDKNRYWQILRKQLRIYGIWNSKFGTENNDWTRALTLLENRKLDLKSLITHRLPFSQLIDGLNIMRNDTIYSNKIMLIDHE